MPTNYVFTNKVILIELSSPQVGGVLTSSLFSMWVEEFSTSFGAGKGLSISVTKAVNTFPLPSKIDEGIADLWQRWWQNAMSWCAESDCGLTTLFNHVHSGDESDAAIQEIRSLLQEIDRRVCDDYGIPFALNYDVRATPRGTRFTVSPEQRAEVLSFLLDLNRERVGQARTATTSRRRSSAASGNLELPV